MTGDVLKIAPAKAEAFACALFVAAGLDADKAAVTARLLVLTDRMGRRTHGLAMAPAYLAELEKGGMTKTGSPDVINDRGAALVWDGRYLPGLWLVNHAIDQAIARIDTHGVVTIAIRRAHHIGCLAALTKQAADRGYIALIANSDPAGRRVAPYGGTEALFTPNPFAIGYPGPEQPVLVDISASITTTSMTRETHAAGRQFEHPWLLDHAGNPTRDPAVLEHATPRGSLQLVGGQDHGHKGFGLALTIEALSQGLSGHGRRDDVTRWGGNVFLQVLDPEVFAGHDAFVEQTGFLSDACRANRPIDPAKPVRIPGDRAAANIAESESSITYAAATVSALDGWAEKLGCRSMSKARSARSSGVTPQTTPRDPALSPHFTSALIEAAFAALGERIRAEGRVIDIAVYGGSALMLVSNFRTSTSDVDAVSDDADQALIEQHAEAVGRALNLPVGWLNDQVFPFLSDRIVGVRTEHNLYRCYPSAAEPSLRVYVPTAEYMCALKLMSLRIEPGTGAKDFADLQHLVAILGLDLPEQALALVSRFYSRNEVAGRVENGIRRLYDLISERGGPEIATPIYHGRGR